MSILHISIGGKSIFPSQRTSKQAYQTRHVPEKREQDQYGSQDTKAPLESHSSLRGTDKVPLSPPFCPPKRQAPDYSGTPARLFPNGVLYVSSHSEDSSDRSHPAHNPPASPPENPRTP